MKWRFTYKELSLLLGILVALIIALTLWIKPVPSESKSISKKIAPKIGVTASKAFLKKIFSPYASFL